MLARPAPLLVPLFLSSLTCLFACGVAAQSGSRAPEARTADDEVADQERSSSFETAQRLLGEGDFRGAAVAFQAVLEIDPEHARGRLGLARALNALGRSGEALGVLEPLQAGDGPEASASKHLQALALEASGMPSAEAFEAAAEAASLGGPVIRWRAAQSALARADHATAAESALAGLQQGSSRRLRIELLETLAQARTSQADLAGAAAALEQTVQLASAPRYAAEQRLKLARLSFELGRRAQAMSLATGIVNDTPHLPSAAQALEWLRELGATDEVTWYSAGLVRYWTDDYRAAERAFDQALAEGVQGEERDRIRLARGRTWLLQGEQAAAFEDLLDLEQTATSPTVGLEAVKVMALAQERVGGFDAAADSYRRLAERYPNQAYASEARFRQGLMQLAAGHEHNALAHWLQAAEQEANGEDRARAWFWIGKVEKALGNDPAAQQAYAEAMRAAPNSAYGLRATSSLESRALQARRASIIEAPTSEAIGPELESWLAGRGWDIDAARSAVRAEPGFQRAMEFIELGETQAAAWEADDLADLSHVDPSLLVAAAHEFWNLGLFAPSARLAGRALSLALGTEETRFDAPEQLLRLAYPIPYPEKLIAVSVQFGVDPLLLASLVRQESAFDPWALSSASAKGLTQVIPSTGHGIARSLQIADFYSDLLYRPAYSLEFGALYLADRLRSLGGSPYLALAAYNAGQGNVEAWLRRLPSQDQELFAELIPFNETRDYVSQVMTNWHTYRRVYTP